MNELRDLWLVTSITHKVSKTATNIFWVLARKYFVRIFAARAREDNQKKIPQFEHLRRQLYKDLPRVNLEIAYRNKESGDVIKRFTDKTPKSNFPADKFEKLYEVATVDVSKLYFS